MIPTGTILIKDGVKYIFANVGANSLNEPLFNLIDLTTGIGFFPIPLNETDYIETLVDNAVFEIYIDFIHGIKD